MKRTLVLAFGLFLVAGCATRAVQTSAVAAVAPQLSVERFLQAVNARDYAGMARIFGTTDGPMGDTGSSFGCFWKKIGAAFGGSSCRDWRDVELQMDALALILQHVDYQIVSEGGVAGRRQSVTRIGVDLTLPQNRVARDVTFVVVMSEGRWMVEMIDLEKVTSATD